MNIVVLKGNLTRDPEIKFTPAGNAKCTFGIAVNESWRDKDGNLKEIATFMDCQCWGKSGEVIAERLRKGNPILIEGKIRQEEWEDKKSGEKKRATRILVEKFEFCGGGRGEDAQAQEKRHHTPAPRQDRPAQRPAPTPKAAATADQPELPGEEDDVPF